MPTFTNKLAFALKFTAGLCLLAGQFQAAFALGGAGLMLGWLADDDREEREQDERHAAFTARTPDHDL